MSSSAAAGSGDAREVSSAAGPSSMGFFGFSFYISMWVFAQFLPILAVIMWWRHGSYILLALIALYFVFRRYVEPKPWPAIQKATAEFVHKYPYFRSQKLVLDCVEMPKPSSQALFSYHMHGVLTCGSLLNGIAHPTVMKSDPRILVGSGLFGIMFLRDLLVWYNFLPWTRKTMKDEMANGRNLIIMPGGFEEASCYKRNAHRTYIKERKGWIKYALQYGYRIYPCYTFGEELTYWTWTGLMKYRLLLNKYQAPGAVFLGKWYTWLPANDVDLITIVGTPLELPKIASPSEEDVSKFHKQYMEALQALFDKYKKKYCVNPDAQLEFVGPSDFGYSE